MTSKRNFDRELDDTQGHRYAYNFDLDVMHRFMIRTFVPFFREGNLLELGSYKGDFTDRLLAYFSDITCVEASAEAISEAAERLENKVHIVNALFENVSLEKRFDNIILTHVLEHLDDPVKLLGRVNNEWLSDGRPVVHYLSECQCTFTSDRS